MITGLSHIAIRTTDLVESVRFYTEVLGLQEAFRMYSEDGSVATVYIYIAPGQFLELFANGSRPALNGNDVVGFCHLCLETADIRETLASVRKLGGPVDSEIKYGKSKCLLFWTHDPDGNPVEIMELIPESMQAEANRRLVPSASLVH